MSIRNNISTILLLGTVIVLGSMATWLTWNLTTKKLIREALGQASLVAQSININRLKNLKGDQRDLATSDYSRIKDQLTQARKTHTTCRFLYLMGRKKDGTVFFFLDAQPTDSKDYAPPGLVYDEVPKEYLHTFNTGESQVVGPITDRWGTLISSLVPVYSPDNHQIVAVLGMDIDASDWKKHVLFQCVLPVGLTVFIVLLISLFLIFNRNQPETTSKIKILPLFLAAVFLPGLFLTWYTWGSTTQRLKENALEQARLIGRSINVERIKNLKGNPTDLNSIDYLRIKEQLFQIRQSHSTCRFLYLMGRKKDGTVFFYLDSQLTSSKDYAPPGLVYKEVSREYLHHFDTGKEGTVGPITDRWGTLVTSLIPIYSKDSDKLTAVLGMDIDARDWAEKAILQCLLPIGLTFFIMFLTTALLLLQDNRRIIKRQNEEILNRHAEGKRLLHILCHDLANPIGTMESILGLLKKDPALHEELLDLAIIANSNASNIIDLVRNLQELDEKGINLALNQYNLLDLITEAQKILGNQLEEKNITLQMAIPDDCTVTVEKTSFINTIINNLLTNAIKFSHPGSSVIVKAENKGLEVRLTIKDNGIGIPPTILESIFDISQKTNRQGTAGEQGTGFGMPLVKRFMDEYHGRIEVESQIESQNGLAQGTTITLFLQQ